jgi:hypothetical protein
MWKDNTRQTLIGMVKDLEVVRRLEYQSMIPRVRELVEESERQIHPSLEGPNGTPIMNEIMLKACEIAPVLELLKAALSKKNRQKALEHAKAALLMLG